MKKFKTRNRKKGSFSKFMPLTLLAAALALTSISCDNRDDDVIIDNPDDDVSTTTAQEFGAIREEALTNITQNFQGDTSDDYIEFTSEKGVQFSLNSDCLKLNGAEVTGQVAIEFVEVFDGGTMLVTDKTTMGKLPGGDMAMLVSGGEFYINATQNGQQLDLECNMNLIIPTSLTAADPEMILWDGAIDADGNMDWEEQEEDPAGGGNDVFLEGNDTVEGTAYYAYFGNFGWTNVDRFYNHAGPKTQILAEVPTGYNGDNSAVYLHYDGEGNALAKLDTYNTATGQFSEHYGQVPVGLECHIIFVTEEAGQWRYAIQGVSITDNAVYTFGAGDTTLGDEETLVAAINELP